jgi:DNA-binding response OmpR family regulator
MPIILIVDDDDAIRAILFDALSEHYECHTASTADEALQYLEVEDYDAILTDIQMPGLDGISLLKRIQLRDLDTPVIFVSGKGGEADSRRLIELGAFAYVTKPFNLDEIEKVIEKAVAASSAETT